MSAQLRPDGMYCAYLRKSRRDVELEELNGGDTLARHDASLTALAHRLGIRISQRYREVVSGDTIADRPQMRLLLEAVQSGAWDGVLVMDVDRLGRGNSIDQGVIMQSFLFSGTLIVTPDKVYDPADEVDSEFFEIKLFFSRREYAQIRKRLERGRMASLMDGCYIVSRPPLGYTLRKRENGKGTVLAVQAEQAAIVRAIFGWYTREELGAYAIATRLRTMGIKTAMGNNFTSQGVLDILGNVTYTGKIRYAEMIRQRSIEDGRQVSRIVRNPNPVIVDGRHEAIIDDETFALAQQIRSRHVRPHKETGKELVNPLAGILRCADCGHMMKLDAVAQRGLPLRYYRCPTNGCGMTRSRMDVVLDAVVEVVEGWLADFTAQGELPEPEPDPAEDAAKLALANLREREKTLNAQLDKLYDLVEQGVYTVELFRSRRAQLQSELAEVAASIASLSSRPQPDPRVRLLPRLRHFAEAWPRAATAARQNALLRTVIDHITYSKHHRSPKNNPGAYLTLDVYPLLIDTDTPDPPDSQQ